MFKDLKLIKNNNKYNKIIKKILFNNKKNKYY